MLPACMETAAELCKVKAELAVSYKAAAFDKAPAFSLCFRIV